MSKNFTMPPIVGVDPHLSRNGTLLTPEQTRVAPPSTQGFSINAGLGFRQGIESRGTRLVDPPTRQAQYQAPNPTYGLAPAHGSISHTLVAHRARSEAYKEQLEFYELLKRYGAVEGNQDSYATALNRYHNDEERKEQEKRRRSEIEQLETQRKTMEREARKSFAEKEESAYQEHRRAQESEIQRQRIRREQMERRRQEINETNWRWSHNPHQQGYAHGYARGGPAEEPQQQQQQRPRSRDDGSHKTKEEQDALAILQLNPHGNPTQREIKIAFNNMALQLHPDKNLHRPDEAAVLFRQVHSAYKFLISKKGGKRKSKRKMNKSRKYKTTKHRFLKRRK